MTSIKKFVEINKVPYTNILVLVKEGENKKYPIYERNNLTIEEIEERNITGLIKNKNGRHTKIILNNPEYVYVSPTEPKYKIKKGDKITHTLSLYLKHTENIYCIDIDDATINNFDTFLNMITDEHIKNVLSKCPYTFGNTKGIHIYISIKNMPNYTDQQEVYNFFKGDCIKKNNMWEYVDKEIYNNHIIPEFEYEQIKSLFNSKINKTETPYNDLKPIKPVELVSIEVVKEIKPISLNNELIDYIELGYKYEIFKLMSGYTNWLNIGFIIYSSLYDDGFYYFDMISKQFPSSTPYNQEEVKNKYFKDIKNSFNPDKDQLTIKSLIKLYKDTDKFIFDKIKVEVKNKSKIQFKMLKEEEMKNKIVSIQDYIFDSKYLSKFNTDYFHTLQGYELRKKYFEIFVCKVLRPDTNYIYTEIDMGNFNCVITRDIELTFKHLNTGETKLTNDGEIINQSFIKKWVCDSNILTYNNMDFKPYNNTRTIENVKSGEIYNLFNGYNPLIKTLYPVEMKDKILKPFKDLLYELVGADDNCFNYLYHYLGHIVQKPNEKLPYAFIFKSKQGVGKNLSFDTIGNMLGSHHYKCSSNPNDFFGEYAEGFFRKLLVVLNECEVKNNFDFQGKIKSFITEDRITLNPKFIRATDISNFARLFIFTNKPNPMNVDFRSIDRRWIVYQSTEKYLDNTKYNNIFWDKLATHLKKPEFISALYDDLNTLNIDKFNFKNRPITKAYYDLVRQYVPIESLFLENYIIENSLYLKSNAPFEKSKKELFDDYKKFCEEYGYEFKFTNADKIILNFKDIDIPFETIKDYRGFIYIFKLKDIHTFLVKRNHIARFDNELEEQEEYIENKLHEDFEDYFI